MNLLHHPVLYCLSGTALAFLFHSIRAGWVGIIILGALIVLYAFMTGSTLQEGNDRREAGDNCYFIGFVYTLVVIIASLILDADTLIENPKPLLNTVGIALGTSATGMILRFIMTQGVQMPRDEFETHVRKAAVAASEISAITHDISLAMNRYTIAIQSSAQAIEEYADKINEQTERVASEAQDPFKRLLQDLAKEIQQTLHKDLFSEFNQQIREVVQRQEQLALMTKQQLTESMDQLRDSAQLSSKSANIINEISIGMRQELERLGKELDGVIERQKNMSKQAGAAAEELKKLEGLRERYSQLSERLITDLYKGLIAGADRAIDKLDTNKSKKS